MAKAWGFTPPPAASAAETDPVAGPALTTHGALTTSAHGGLVASNDSKLTDIRGQIGAHKTACWYIPYPYIAGTAGVVTQDQVYYIPLLVGAAWSIDRIGVYLTVGGAANSVLRAGIFANDSNGQPGTVVEDLGTKAVDTTTYAAPGEVTWTPSGGSSTLTAHTWYWLGVVGQNVASPGTGITMPTLNRTSLVAFPHRVVASTSTVPSGLSAYGGMYFQSAVTGAFATAVPAATSSSTVPFLMLRTL